jgi:hypothetical protein
MPAKRASIPQEEIIRDVKLGVPYSQIKEKYGLNSTSIITRLMKRFRIEEQKDMLKTAKKQHEEDKPETPASAQKVKPMSQRQRKAIQKGAIAFHVLNKAEIITDRFIDVFKGMKYTISEFIDVNEGMKEYQVEIPIHLHKLIDLLKNNQSFDREEKEQFNLLIYHSLKAISNIYANVDRRIASLRELNNSLEKYGKVFQQLQFMEGINRLMEVFFEGLNMVDDEQYFRIKGFIIGREPFSEQYFNKYETEEEVPNQ